MSAPAVVTIRPGVTFTPAAAASFRRMETTAGRQIDVNSTYRDWNLQYKLWQAWVNRVPGAPYALHPDNSMHCRGLALDTDDVTLVRRLSDHGWRQTALYPGAPSKNEPWHFEYQSARDAHTGAPAGGRPLPIPKPSTPTLRGRTMRVVRSIKDDVGTSLWPQGHYLVTETGVTYAAASNLATVNRIIGLPVDAPAPEFYSSELRDLDDRLKASFRAADG